MQSLPFLITTMFQMGINKKITFNKHFARKYIRAYTVLPIRLKIFDNFTTIVVTDCDFILFRFVTFSG